MMMKIVKDRHKKKYRINYDENPETDVKIKRCRINCYENPETQM